MGAEADGKRVVAVLVFVGRSQRVRTHPRTRGNLLERELERPNHAGAANGAALLKSVKIAFRSQYDMILHR